MRCKAAECKGDGSQGKDVALRDVHLFLGVRILSLEYVFHVGASDSAMGRSDIVYKKCHRLFNSANLVGAQLFSDEVLRCDRSHKGFLNIIMGSATMAFAC